MNVRRKSIKLLDHELAALEKLYLRRRIPIDQFEGRPDDLASFMEEWRQLTGRDDVPGELIHYMRSRRKRGLWPRLEGNHLPTPPLADLSPEETEVLVKIFGEHVTLLDSGSDVLAYDDEIADLIAKEFAAEAGRVVPAHQLVAKLTALRKRGLLPKVGKPVEKDPDIGFEDIDEAIG